MFDYLYWEFVRDSLLTDGIVAIAFVTDHQGSSPGRKGFRFAIDKNSRTFGTVGGGIMEYNIIKEMKSLLTNSILSSKNFTLLELIHNRKVSKDKQSGLICSGKQSVIYGLLTNDDLPIIKDIIKLFFDNNNHVLTITPKSFTLSKNNTQLSYNEGKINFIINGEDWAFELKTSLHNHIYIFGAGHVGQAISNLFETLNFVIHVLDFREDLIMKSIKEEKWITREFIEDYARIQTSILESKNTYIAVVNANSLHDIESLFAIIRKKFNYIGLMGTTAKRIEIFKALRERGVTEEEISQIVSPIGVNIKSQTSAEIAISIASQIIILKNSKTSY